MRVSESWRSLSRMRCFQCAQEAEVAPGERVGFRDECAGCGADLHVCRNCAHHDPAAYNECRESSAERVGERDRANRCEWFRPGSQESGTDRDGQDSASAALEALFKKT